MSDTDHLLRELVGEVRALRQAMAPAGATDAVVQALAELRRDIDALMARPLAEAVKPQSGPGAA